MAQVDVAAAATQSVAEACSSGDLSRITAELSSVAIKFSKELKDCRDGDNLSAAEVHQQQDRVKRVWADAGLLSTLLNGFHTLIIENECVKNNTTQGGEEDAHVFDQLVRMSELCGSITSLMRGLQNDTEHDAVADDYSSHPYADVFVAMVMRHLWNLRATDAFGYPWMLFFLFHANGSTRNQYLQTNLLSFCLWIGEQYVRETQPTTQTAAETSDTNKSTIRGAAGKLLTTTGTSVAEDEQQESSSEITVENGHHAQDVTAGSIAATKQALPAHVRTVEQFFDAITTCGARLGALYATADVKALWRITQEAKQSGDGTDVRKMTQLSCGDAYLLVDYVSPSQGGDHGGTSAARSKEAPQHSKQAHRRVCAFMSEHLHSWFADRPRKRAAVLRTTLLMGLTMYLHVKGGDVDENAQGALDSLSQLSFVALDLQDASVVETLLRVVQDQTLRCDSELFHLYGEPFSLTGSCGTPDEGIVDSGDSSSTPYNFLLQLWQAYYVAASSSSSSSSHTTSDSVIPSSLTTSPSCNSRIVWFWAMLAYEVTHAVKGSSFLSQAATVFVANIVPVMENYASTWEYSHGASLLMHYFLEIADAILQSRQCPDSVFDIFCVEDFHRGWSSLNLYIQEYTKAVLTSPDVWELIGMGAFPKSETVENVSDASTFWWPNKPFNVTKHRIRLLQHYAVIACALKDGGDYVEGWVCTEHPARFLVNATTGPVMRILTYGVPHTSTTNMTALRYHALQLLQELARPDPMAGRSNETLCGLHRDGVSNQPRAFFRSHDAAAYSRVLYLKFLQMFRRSCEQPHNRELILLTTALSRTVRVLCQAGEAAVREAERLGVPAMISNEMDRVREKMLAISTLEDEDEEFPEEGDASSWLYSAASPQSLHVDLDEPGDLEASERDTMSRHTIEMRTDSDSDTNEQEIVVDIETDESQSDEPCDNEETTEDLPAILSLPSAGPAIPKLSLGDLMPPMYFMSNGDTAAMQEQTRTQAQQSAIVPSTGAHKDHSSATATQRGEKEETLGSPASSRGSSLVSKHHASQRAPDGSHGRTLDSQVNVGDAPFDSDGALAYSGDDSTIEVYLDETVTQSHVSSPKRRRVSKNVSSSQVASQLSGLFADDTLHSEIIYLMMSLVIGKNGMIREYYTQLMATETKYTYVLFSLQHHCLHSVNESTATRLRELITQDCANPGVRVLFRFLDRYSSPRHDSLSLLEHIGRGAYGTVFGVEMPLLPGEPVRKDNEHHHTDTQSLAVKTAPAPHHHHDREAIVSFHAEALALLCAHGHRGVVSMADFGFDGVHYVIMMPRYRTSLKTWRTATFPRNAASDPESVWKSLVVTYRTLCIVETLHTVHIRHNDIKADNIFLDVPLSGYDEGATDEPHTSPEFYLGDYGESDCISDRYRPSTERSRGTEAVRPPEELLPHAFTDAKLRADQILTSDVWSCGCLLYEMLTGEMLFEQTHIGKLFGYIAGDEDIFEPWHLEAIQEAGEDVVAVLRSLLHWNPMERPSATKAKALLRELFESEKWNSATGMAKQTDWRMETLKSAPKDRHADDSHITDEHVSQQCSEENEENGIPGEVSGSCVLGGTENGTNQGVLDPWCVRVLPNIGICQEDASITDIYALGATHMVAFRRDVPFSDHVFCLDATVVSSPQWDALMQIMSPPGVHDAGAVTDFSDDDMNENLDSIASFLFGEALPFLLGAVHKNGFALIPAFCVGPCNVAHLVSAIFISVTYAVPATTAALHACTQDEGTGVDVYTCATLLSKMERRLSASLLTESFTMYPSIVRSTGLTRVHTKLVASQSWLHENDLCNSTFAVGTQRHAWFRCLCGALCYRVKPASQKVASYERDDVAASAADFVSVEHSTSSGVITLHIPQKLMVAANGEGDCDTCAPEILTPVMRFLDAASNVYPGLLSRISPIPLLEAASNDDDDNNNSENGHLDSDTREDGDHEVCADCRMPTLLSFGGSQYELGMFPLFTTAEPGTPDPIELNVGVERSLAALWGGVFHLRRINAPQLWW